MKLLRTVVLFCIVVNLISCEKEEVLSIEGKKFTHQIQGCERNDNTEINCSEFLIFENKEEGKALVGGSDIIMTFNYQFKNENTVFVLIPNTTIEYTFSLTHPDTLLDTSSGQKWIRELP